MKVAAVQLDPALGDIAENLRRCEALALALERHIGPELGPSDHGLLGFEVVEPSDRLLAEDGHRVPPHVARAVRGPVTEQVETEDSITPRGERLRDRRLHPSRPHKAVQRDEDAWTHRRTLVS